MLRKLKLYGDLAEVTGHKEFDVQITSIAQAVSFLINNFPQLENYMSNRYYKILVDKNETDIDELHRCLEAVLRQNHQQGIFISRCMDKIHNLYAKIACIENRVEQPKKGKEGLTQFFSTFFDPKS